MPEAQPDRRLVAILFADMVGYTRLIGADERAAIATVERSRTLIGERVEARGGSFLEHEGDGTLSTFPSAVEAVSAALEIQRAARSLCAPGSMLAMSWCPERGSSAMA